MRISMGPNKKVVFPHKNEPKCNVKSFQKWTPNYAPLFADEKPRVQIKVDPKVTQAENVPKKELVLKEEQCTNPYCQSLNVASFFLNRIKTKIMVKCFDCGFKRIIQ